MANSLNSTQKAKMAVLILLVAIAFYFNFRSKKELFFSSEYLYERMLRNQKATHFNSKKDVSDYQEKFAKLREDFNTLIPKILASPLSADVWTHEERELVELADQKSYDWNQDVFAPFRRDWKGSESLNGHYKYFTIKNFDEYRSEDNLFVQYISMTNRSGNSFYGLNTYIHGKGPIILSEMADITENLSWSRVGWPVDAQTILWFTYLGERNEIHHGYRISLQKIGLDQMQVKALEVLVDKINHNPVKIDIIRGDYK